MLPDLLTPHEHLDLLPTEPVTPEETGQIIEIMRRFNSQQIKRGEELSGTTDWRHFTWRTIRLILRYARVLDMWTHPGIYQFNDKVRFVEIMTGLGYHAPRTLFVEAQPFDPAELKQRILATGWDTLLLKPKDGAKGRGLLRTRSVDEAVEHLIYTSYDYMVQPALPVVRDFRYMLYTDTAGRKWRVVYDKHCPSFLSDGRPLWKQVMDRKPALDRRGLRSLRDRYRHRTFEPIPAGEVLFIALSGNVAQGAQYLALTEQETATIDRFMAVVKAEMETVSGAPLNFFCLDLGATSMDLLTRPYDFAMLKREMVFFEYQFFANVVINSGEMDPEAFYDRMKAMYVRDAIARTADRHPA
jgi:hypothetical protein